MTPGLVTLVNAAAVIVGASIGALAGDRVSDRIHEAVTLAIGLTVVLLAALSLAAVRDPAFLALVGDSGGVLVGFGGLVTGAVIGSALRLEDRLDTLGARLRDALGRTRLATLAGRDAASKERFVEGFVTASLVFCVGPLTILGALSDGLGLGPEELLLKSTLDFFAAVAFAAAFGWGVAATAVVVLLVQGSLTLLAVLSGDWLSAGHVAAMTLAGGFVLAALSIRVLRLREVPVADLLPALVTTPVLAQAVGSL